MSKAKLDPEAAIKALSKLPHNRRCADCSAENASGHSYVCDKYRSFICSNCKSAHQAFSHRVKTINQTNWTPEDVTKLRDASGGGNENCRRRWWAKCPPNMRLTPESPINQIKDMINKAYEHEMWVDYNAELFRPDAPSSGAAPSFQQNTARSVSSQSAPGSVSREVSYANSFESASSGGAGAYPPPQMNTFSASSTTSTTDTSSFDPFSPVSNVTAVASSSAPTSSNEPFQSSFDFLNSSSSAPVPAPVSASAAATIQSVPAFASTSSAHVESSSSSNDLIDLFGSFSSPPVPSTPASTPLVSNASGGVPPVDPFASFTTPVGTLPSAIGTTDVSTPRTPAPSLISPSSSGGSGFAISNMFATATQPMYGSGYAGAVPMQPNVMNMNAFSGLGVGMTPQVPAFAMAPAPNMFAMQQQQQRPLNTGVNPFQNMGFLSAASSTTSGPMKANGGYDPFHGL